MTSAPWQGRLGGVARAWIIGNSDLSFAILLSIGVYAYFAATNGLFATHNTLFAIMERFAVLGPIGLSLSLCIIAGEIDLSIGSNAALAAVIIVRLSDLLGAFNAILIGLTTSTLVGVIQGYLIAYLRVRAIVLTVGTLMLLRGVALFAANEKTVMLTNFDVPDFIQMRMLAYFSPASLLTIGLFVLVGLFMTYTKYGREIYAIGGARKEALAAGIGLMRPMIIVFAISGFCAGLGGAVIGLRSGTAQALGLQYLLLAGTVAAFIGGVSILGGRGGVIGAAIGTLTVNFLDTGLVFNVAPAYVVQLCLGVLLVVVIMFQTSSRLFDLYQKRQSLLAASDRYRVRAPNQTNAAAKQWQGSLEKLNFHGIGQYRRHEGSQVGDLSPMLALPPVSLTIDSAELRHSRAEGSLGGLAQLKLSVFIRNDFYPERPVIAGRLDGPQEPRDIETSFAAKLSMMDRVLDQSADRLRRSVRQFDIADHSTGHRGNLVIGDSAAAHVPDINQKRAVGPVRSGDNLLPGLEVGDI